MADGLTDWGRKEIQIAGPNAGPDGDPGAGPLQQPLRGAHHRLAAHDDQTAVLIETLQALGAEVRWASAIFARPRTTRRRLLPPRHAGVRLQGRILEEYWEFTHRIFEWPDGGYSNMIWTTAGCDPAAAPGHQGGKDADVITHPGMKNACSRRSRPSSPRIPPGTRRLGKIRA